MRGLLSGTLISSIDHLFGRDRGVDRSIEPLEQALQRFCKLAFQHCEALEVVVGGRPIIAHIRPEAARLDATAAGANDRVGCDEGGDGVSVARLLPFRG